MAADFKRRSSALELMDDPAIAPDELMREFDHLDAFNRFLGGYATTLSALGRLLPRGRPEFSLLDVGAGGGDTALRVAAWAKRRGLLASIEAVDLSPTATEYARARTAGFPRIRCSTRDLFALPDTETFDIVHAALVLHHCPGDEHAARALRKMWSLCRLGMIVNDLHRHPAAYHGVKLIAGLSGSRFTRHDAPLSVLRAFSKADLERLARLAGLPTPEIRWTWAFRWRMIVRR